MLTRERTKRPGHLAHALGQPGQNSFANEVVWGSAGAQWGRRSLGLNTGVQGRRALVRFQALRLQILWFGRVTKRHIVLCPAYDTTGGVARAAELFVTRRSDVVDAGKAEAAVSQAGDDFGKCRAILGGAPNVQHIHRAWCGQPQAARDDVL